MVTAEIVENLLKEQKKFFSTGETKKIEFRLIQLKKLQSAIKRYEAKIADALWKDLHKSPEEAYLTEISIVLQEIALHVGQLKRWAKPQKAATPLPLLPSRSRIVYEPLGNALIISPWNYPFQLLLNPLVGAISAGCCAILKASPYAQNTAKIVEELIAETFPSEYASVVQGNRDVNQMLLAQRFDIIFFTGSPAIGKKVMQSAAVHLTPVVLELGGKSPCIVDENADLDIAAKRIAWGKSINAGQTCIAPDYLFIHKSVKQTFVEKYKRAIVGMYGEDCKQSKYFPRIINQKAIERIKRLMQHGDIVFGGEIDEEQRYVAPTLIDNVKPEYPVMQEEIFAPVLPMMTFEDIASVVDYINSGEKPLAFYYFGKNKKAAEILSRTTSGGACVNDTLLHVANHYLPFGGVGNSGTGKYHGRESFLSFSNKRAIVSSCSSIDLSMKYPPFRNFSLMKKLL